MFPQKNCDLLIISQISIALRVNFLRVTFKSLMARGMSKLARCGHFLRDGGRQNLTRFFGLDRSLAVFRFRMDTSGRVSPWSLVSGGAVDAWGSLPFRFLTSRGLLGIGDTL
uniref:Uncharacterized protein n=1 Tax=Cacopsylla melanoneura TaxID=428564 RepID=A0A8D8W4A4_9HEMI